MEPANRESKSTQGVLYLVATPIGNLEDITLRALRILKEADLLVAEDTRHTMVLLQHYGIQAHWGPSLYEGADPRKIEELIARLQSGSKIALVSDAGTPLIQDPGYPLVRRAIEEQIPVIAIPGPTALITALVQSGLPTDHFIFDGIPSKKNGKRKGYFQSLQEETRTVIIYESPHRIMKTLAAITEVLPERRIVLCRELTKIHEEVLRGTAAELLRELESRPSVKGEMVLLIEGKLKMVLPVDM
jgi:16S rRNA (cytidine1402-2'-O)-methyltransferase